MIQKRRSKRAERIGVSIVVAVLVCRDLRRFPHPTSSIFVHDFVDEN
jgi:hypothetical protein